MTRRAVVIWNSSPYAVDAADSVYHEERLNGARLAVQAFNILGLRDTASEFMKGDYLHASLFGVAQNADKVKLYLIPRYSLHRSNNTRSSWRADGQGDNTQCSKCSVSGESDNQSCSVQSTTGYGLDWHQAYTPR
jgi:hypothetical protein